MSTLQAGNRGCFVVKFSNDGRFVAGCYLHTLVLDMVAEWM
jgi:hypothetical protein